MVDSVLSLLWYVVTFQLMVPLGIYMYIYDVLEDNILIIC